MSDAEKTGFMTGPKREQQPQLDRETALFKMIGLRQALTTYGQQERYKDMDADGWTFTQEGFGVFGVNQIDIINPPWMPRLLTLHAKIVTLPAR
jgi:hypothetical protein